MYSKNKFYFLNLNHTKKFKNYSKNTQFQKILTIYDDYIKFFNDSIKNQFESKNNQKLLVRFANNFLKVINIIEYIFVQKISINQYFKTHHSLSKAQFYLFLKKIIHKIQHPYINWKSLLGKLPIPKNSHYKYSISDRTLIVDKYKTYLQNSIGGEITNFWCHLKSENSKFAKISLNTLKKILTSELGIVFKHKVENQLKHPKRTKYIESGHIQLDLKILGVKENGLKEKIAIFNMIDTSSRFVYSAVLEDQSTSSVMKHLRIGYQYFKNNKIYIKSIQTDNAMMFKGTNFIHYNEFRKFCIDNKILKRLIPLGQPQCNGCIERFHKTIDDCCLNEFRIAKSFEEIQKIVNKFMTYYNYQRFHHYSELNHLPNSQRYLIPKNAIDSLIILYRSGLV